MVQNVNIPKVTNISIVVLIPSTLLAQILTHTHINILGMASKSYSYVVLWFSNSGRS